MPLQMTEHTRRVLLRQIRDCEDAVGSLVNEVADSADVHPTARRRVLDMARLLFIRIERMVIGETNSDEELTAIRELADSLRAQELELERRQRELGKRRRRTLEDLQELESELAPEPRRRGRR